MTPSARKARLVLALRRAGIADTRILATIERLPREQFVPDALKDQAYELHALPIGQGQTLSRPDVVAAMTQALSPGPRDKVLEVGTGSGYQTAVLARLSRRVYTVERHRDLLDLARTRLDELRCHNVTSRPGDGWRGWPEQAPFPRILVTAAAARIPERLVDQLGRDGVMVVPVDSERGEQDLLRIDRDGEGRVTETWLARVRFVPLVSTDDDACPGS